MTLAGAERPTFLHEVAEHCLSLLRGVGVALPRREVNWSEFADLSTLVHRRFEVPSTTFTPMMRRLLFAISTCVEPRSIVGAGTYVGYTLAWLARSRSRATAERIIGIDVDPVVNAIARRNCRALGHGARLRFIDGDARLMLRAMTEPIDLLFIDIDNPQEGKAGYPDVLRASLPLLHPGSLVLAHDPCVPQFAESFAAYDAYVRSCPELRGPCMLPIDPCGLSVVMVH